MENQTLEQEREFWRNNLDKVSYEPTTLDREVEYKDALKQIPESNSKKEIPKAKTEVDSEPEMETEISKDSNDKEIQKDPLKSDKSNPNDAFRKSEVLKQKSAKEKTPERQAITWEQIHKEKAELATARQNFETEKASLRKQLEDQVREEYRKKRPDITEIQPETWRKLAENKKAEAEKAYKAGNKALADQLDLEARDCRNQAEKIENDLKAWNQEEETRKQKQDQYQKEVKAHKDRVVQEIRTEFPELEKLDSPIRQQLDHYYKDAALAQFFNTHPNGYWYAVHLADVSARAESASVLAEENIELKAELKKLNKGRSPSQSFDNGTVKEKNVATQPLDQQRKFWRNEFVKLDRYGAAA